MKSSSYSPYIRDHGSSIRSIYVSSIDMFSTMSPINWRCRVATIANSDASISHIRKQVPAPEFVKLSICYRVACVSSRTESPCIMRPLEDLRDDRSHDRGQRISEKALR